MVNVVLRYLPIEELSRIRGVNQELRYTYFVSLAHRIREGIDVEEAAIVDDNLYLLLHVLEIKEQLHPGTTVLTQRNKDPWMDRTLEKAFKHRSLDIAEWLASQVSLGQVYNSLHGIYCRSPMDNKPPFLSMLVKSPYLVSLIAIYIIAKSNGEKGCAPVNAYNMLSRDAEKNIDGYMQACEILHQNGILMTHIIEPGYRALCNLSSKEPRNKKYHNMLIRAITLHDQRCKIFSSCPENKDLIISIADMTIASVTQPRHKGELEVIKRAAVRACEQLNQ